ncbi:uncharacterized protein LOC111593661 [Drosophila hydei]|uniref:Uncharacterized protein LOC111593661 n=1 Tax=Drosophila hydei TaxID=7224 RepID=A0A6J1LAY3_DROHY|nr:uncharacterized protein LOC111593661 [Drosophila hydei]
MCGGWACASYSLACNNPPLSTTRFTGRDFIPTPCGPYDKCCVADTSCNRGNCMRHQNITVELTPCAELTSSTKSESVPNKQARDNWQSVYNKVKCIRELAAKPI